MLARLICFLLGHVFDDNRLFLPQPGVRIRRGQCSRCGAVFIEILDPIDPNPRRGPLDTR